MWVLALALTILGTTGKFVTFVTIGILNLDFRVKEGIYFGPPISLQTF